MDIQMAQNFIKYLNEKLKQKIDETIRFIDPKTRRNDHGES